MAAVARSLQRRCSRRPGRLIGKKSQPKRRSSTSSISQEIVDRTKANPKLYAETAIIISFDESGGLYDSGFIQPLDFFGDGPRMPMLVISPFSTGGRVVHSYNDQASVLKFIERNWHLGKISNSSRDNLPNPVMDRENPWVPVNMPAIGDLFDMFDFHDHDGDHGHDDRHDHDNDGDRHGDRL